MAEHHDLGKGGEDEAALYLEDEGYTIIDRDWRLGRRDLDILAYTPDGNTLWGSRCRPAPARNTSSLKRLSPPAR